MDEKLILDEIENNKEEYIEFLRDLIQTESYNPPGNENNVALILKKYLEDAKLTCEVFPFGENRANLFSQLNNIALALPGSNSTKTPAFLNPPIPNTSGSNSSLPVLLIISTGEKLLSLFATTLK